MNKDKQAILQVAKQLIWWLPPEDALLHPKRQITQILEYSTPRSVRVMFEYFSWDEIIDALDNPLPGIFSKKSWNFWHVYFGKYVPPLPSRVSVLKEL